MTHLRGMIVRIQTDGEAWAGTDDMLYIGVYGKGGGREFPLDVKGFNDWEKGTDIKYHLGTVWDGAALNGTKKPIDSEPGQKNDPMWHRVELDEVDYVYIRKQGDNTKSGDDRYRFETVEVTLYGANPITRTFIETSDLYLANETGQICYIPEG